MTIFNERVIDVNTGQGNQDGRYTYPKPILWHSGPK
jgi:hypothetical protein